MLGLGITAAYWLHAQDLDDQASTLTQQRQQLDARYQAIAQHVPGPEAAAPEQLAQTVTLAQQLDARQMNTHALLAAISPALQQAPEITLENLSWTDDPLDPCR